VKKENDQPTQDIFYQAFLNQHLSASFPTKKKKTNRKKNKKSREIT
jgi:hypothetical protein